MTFSHAARLASRVTVACILAGCSGGGGSGDLGSLGSSAPATSSVATFGVRAVNGSPDAGPVDVYVYAATGAQPATPTFANVQYPGITAYVTLPATGYTIAFDRAGTQTQIETESLAGTTSGAQVTTALAGQAAANTLQFQNFIEPAEAAGTTALIVHHASPATDAQTTPIGIGVYAAINAARPAAAATTQLFTFALTASSAASPGTSGPATAGVSGGEYFSSPISSALPSPLGFAAGAPGNGGGTLASVIASSTLSGLAVNLSPAGYGRPAGAQTLAADTANTVPAGAHLSVFLVDSATSAPAILIGTLDP